MKLIWNGISKTVISNNNIASDRMNLFENGNAENFINNAL